jgi:hypothetical protein
VLSTTVAIVVRICEVGKIGDVDHSVLNAVFQSSGLAKFRAANGVDTAGETWGTSLNETLTMLAS